MYQFKYTVTLYYLDCQPIVAQGFDDFTTALNWGAKELNADNCLHGFIIFDKDKNVVYFSH